MVKSMTWRKKAQIVRWAGFFFLFLLVWLCTLSSAFVPILICSAILYTAALFMLRCPGCRKPVAWNSIGLDPIGWILRRKTFSCTLDIPRQCSRCGTSLE